MMTSACRWLVGSILLALSPCIQGAESSIELTGATGIYSLDQWKHDWPGCKFQDGINEEHVSLVEKNGTKSLRVDYETGQIGPEKNGAGWRFPIGSHQSVEFRYTLTFSKDFDWVKGGKLPGLAGGPDNVSGGRPATGENGFSARLMWRKDGRGEAYVYHLNQKGKYGDSFAFPDDFRFPTELPIHVRIRVDMNKPGANDGTLSVWVALGDEPEKLLVERKDIAWRSVDTFGVDSIYFETFHGGSDASWAPTRESWAEFENFSYSADSKP